MTAEAIHSMGRDAGNRVAIAKPDHAHARPAILAFPAAVWFVVVTSFAQFRFRHANELWEGTGIDSQVKLHMAIWGLLGLLACWCVWTGRIDWRLLRGGPLKWYVLYALLALSTVAISKTPQLTIFRGAQLLVTVVLVASLRDHIQNMHWYICLYVGINSILSLLANAGLHGGMEWLLGLDDMYVIWADHPYEPWRFATSYGHPSIISITAAVAAIGIAARAHGRQWMTHGPILVWLMLSVGLTSSRTAIAGMLGGLLIVAWGRGILFPLILIGGTAFPLGFVLPQVRRAADTYVRRGQTNDEFQSLTGRDLIYAEAFRRIQQSWPIGFGFQSGRYELLDDVGSFAGITHSHNLILESAVNMGLAGVISALSVVGSLLIAAYIGMKQSPREANGSASIGFEVAGLLCPMLAFCVLDRGFASCCGPDLVCFLSVAALARYVSLPAVDVALRADEPEVVEHRHPVFSPQRTEWSPG